MVGYIRCVLLLVSVLGSTVTGAPAGTDVQVVESTLREVRAIAPDDLLLAETNYGHNYKADDEDSVGYLKRFEDGGSDGYKHFDSYHKKDGDKYGYEKHTSFGKANKADYDAGEKAEGDGKGDYKIAEELNEGSNENEGYEGEGESEKLTAEVGEADSGEHYTAGADDGSQFTGEHFEIDEGAPAKYTDTTHEGLSAEEADNYE